MPFVLEELLEEAPVTWARSYGGPLLPPMILRELITDFPRDIPEERRFSFNTIPICKTAVAKKGQGGRGNLVEPSNHICKPAFMYQ